MSRDRTISWKTRGRLLGIAILCTGFISANANGIAAARPGPLVQQDNSEASPDLNVAQVQAREHLNRFFQDVMGADGVARKGAALRIALTGDNGRREDVWVTPFARRDGFLMGILADEPRQSSIHSSGDLVTFSVDDVRDWSFFGEDGRMYGNYTTRLLLSAVGPDRAAEISALLSKTPAPADW